MRPGRPEGRSAVLEILSKSEEIESCLSLLPGHSTLSLSRQGLGFEPGSSIRIHNPVLAPPQASSHERHIDTSPTSTFHVLGYARTTN